MLKKLVNIIIVGLLLVSTTGFSLSKHYCGSNLIEVKLNQEAKSCCGMNSQCCHNEVNHFQLDEDFSFSFANYEISLPGILISVIEYEFSQLTFYDNLSKIVIEPPGKVLTKIIKLISCFLI